MRSKIKNISIENTENFAATIDFYLSVKKSQ